MLIIRERKRRRSAKCMDIKEEAIHLLKVLGEMMQSCKHPQHLAETVSKMMDQNRQLLTKTVSELEHMIRNQSATKDNVCQLHHHGDELRLSYTLFRSHNVIILLPW